MGSPDGAVAVAARASHATLHGVVAACRGLFGSLMLTMTGIGLLGAALGVRAEHEGMPTIVTSAVMACYYVGFLLGPHAIPFVVRRVGPVGTYACLTVAGGIAPLGQGLLVHPISWALLRIVTGASISGTYTLVESWLNHLVVNSIRGRLIAVYLTIAMAGVVGGQLLLGVVSPDHMPAFVVAAAWFAAATIPIALQPPPPAPTPSARRTPLLTSVRAHPIGALCATASGVMFGGLSGMSAVYATKVGMPRTSTAWFLAIGTLGSVLLAFPISSWADRSTRRRTMIGVSALGLAAALALIVTPARGVGAFLPFFVIWGCSTSLYTLANVYVNDSVSAEQRVTIASVVIALAGVGSILGPLLIGAAMAATGPKAMFAVVGATFALLIGVLGPRRTEAVRTARAPASV